MNKKILVSGSIAFDYIMNFPGVFSDHIIAEKIHDLNVSFTIDQLKKMQGGTGANIAYNLGLLGLQPVLLGVAGQGFDSYAKGLKKEGVITDFVKQDNNEAMAGAYIMTDQKDNQITGFFPGPQDSCYSEVVEELGQVDLAIVSPDAIDRMLGFVKKYQAKNIAYIFDPGQQITSFGKEDLMLAIQGAKVLVCNDYEFALITKITQLSKEKILQTVELLFVTKGEKGSEVCTGKERFDILPAKPKALLDPTGAGDAYRAGLIFGLVNDWSLEKIGRIAGLIAVHAVESYGTQNHSFSWVDLEKRYQENFNEKI